MGGEFRANGESLAIDTEEIKIDKSYKLDNGVTINIDKYTKNDSGEVVKFMLTNSSYDEPILEREDISLELDVKNIKLNIYMAEIEGYGMANKEDFELVVEAFVIE